MVKEWVLRWLFNLESKDKYVTYLNSKVDIPVLNEKDEQVLIDFLYMTTRSIMLKEEFSIKKTLILICVSIFTEIIMRHKDTVLLKLQTAETLDDVKNIFLELEDGNDTR